jgi:hypothetical protein
VEKGDPGQATDGGVPVRIVERRDETEKRKRGRQGKNAREGDGEGERERGRLGRPEESLPCVGLAKQGGRLGRR